MMTISAYEIMFVAFVTLVELKLAEKTNVRNEIANSRGNTKLMPFGRS